MEAAPQQQQQGQAADQRKLKIDKFADGPITCLKLSGTIDEQFDGKKIAATLKGGTLVLDLADIQKISSFGIREWVDFVNRVGEGVDQIYLIECAPKVVDQLNMVANFAGKGRVFSFYAPYRCDYCDADRRVLLQFDKDYEAIKGMKPPERPCQGCGNPEYFDEDPTSFFSYLAAQPKFELDPGVASFLASKLNYAVSDSARRLRVEKYVEGRSTYLKVAGDLDGSFPREKVAEGLEGAIVVDVSGCGKIDPAGAAEWRSFLEMITPTCDQIYLLGCPPVFVERLTRPEDLGAKTQVISFAMPYSCAKCATTASQQVDVQQNFDVLKFATPPEMKCLDCSGPTTCAATEGLLSHLPQLPKPTVSDEIRKFIKDVQERKPEKQQIATTVAEAAARQARSSWVMMLVSLAGAAVIAAGVVFGLTYYQQRRDEQRIQAREGVGKLRNKSAAAKPDWIKPDWNVRYAAYCVDEKGAIACVGASLPTDTQDEARVQATEAALEEMASSLALKIDDPTFRQMVRPIYADARQLAVSEFEKARNEADGAKYDRTKRTVGEGRKNVTTAFRKSGGAAVPAQPAADYWEEYEAMVGGGSKFVVFVQYRLSGDALKQLVTRYTETKEALGAKTMTGVPELAWRYPDVVDGAIIVALAEGALRSMGLAPQYIVMSVRDRKVSDAADFAAKIDEEWTRLRRDGGNVKFEVKTGDGPTVAFNRPVPKDLVETPVKVPGTGGGTRPIGPGTGGTNVWDNTGGGGGGGGRDNPNE